MSTARQCSTSTASIYPVASKHVHHNSISAHDMPALAQVRTRVLEDATRAAHAERAMTLREGFKTYPQAIMWSLLVSTCIIMEGFDIVLINSLFGLPAFQKKFGTQSPDGSFGISAAWESALANGAITGEITGLFIVGWLAERWGYRTTLIAALGLVTGFIFIPFFAQNLPTLLVGLFLCGIPWGAFQTLTTTYASEVCPVALRAYLTTYVNLCWVIGQFLASGVLKGVSHRDDAFGYKLPYGLQWIWPIPLIVVVAFAPESPWWLVRKGRKEEAKRSMLRLTSRDQPNFDAGDTVSMMVYTTELERANTEGFTYRDCFRGADLRRTEICCMVWAIQTLCGSSSITGFSTYFFEQAGLDLSNAFSLTLGQYGLGFLATLASWFLMGRCGRRTLYLWGQIAMALLLVTVGLLAIPKSKASAEWTIGGTVMLYNFVYNLTLGPVCYSLVAELASTRLRNKTVVLARNVYNMTTIVANVLAPRMLNPHAWHWGAKAAFFWAGACTLGAIWTYFRLPEPKGRLYVELDMLFHARVPARQFRSTGVVSLAADGVHLRDDSSRNADTKVDVHEMQRVVSGSSAST
ncbi:sugar porter family MFS transporter [Teratosphaeria destructans]|uniref:Sugar porter family MFS transporter n=1 Tax=Teratosphaeria destructans TaxID=418781 RepID=A0A9W7SYZ8_9PEZI|nr:sugar porter family MFS transporter [Teratosphaeria destructans]